MVYYSYNVVRWSTIVITWYILSSPILIRFTVDYKMVFVLEGTIVICTLITMSLISWDISLSSIFNQQVM